MAKISISLDDDLLETIREQSGPGGVSQWLAAAAARQVRAHALRTYAAEAEAETGPPSPEAVAQANAWLSSATRPS